MICIRKLAVIAAAMAWARSRPLSPSPQERSGPGRLRGGDAGQAGHHGADGHGLRPRTRLGPLSSSKEVNGFGGKFETRDPNWSIEAGAQAITEAISSDPKPDVLIVHSPDLNSYSKLFKKAQEKGIYVILIDNPDQLPGRRLRRQRLGPARPARGRSRHQGLRRRLLEEDRPGAGRPGQRLEPLSICRHHEGAGRSIRTSRSSPSPTRTGTRRPRAMSTTTMLQQNPDICGDHRLLGRRRHRRCGGDPRCRQAGQDLPRHHRRRRKGRLRQARSPACSARW